MRALTQHNSQRLQGRTQPNITVSVSSTNTNVDAHWLVFKRLIPRKEEMRAYERMQAEIDRALIAMGAVAPDTGQ